MEGDKPIKQRFKNRMLQKMYETARRAAQDPASEFFNRDDGTPRRGANVRNAYWNGRSGEPSTWRIDSLAHAAWAAGQDDLKDFGPVEGSQYKFGPRM